MFLKLLEKLVDEYAGQPSYMGGDLEDDLCATGRSLCDAAKLPYNEWSSHTLGCIRALYSLGVLVALPAPAEGEVAVDVPLALALLRVVKTRRIDRCLACKGCGQDVDPDATRLKKYAGAVPDIHKPVEIWDVYAFCSDCAAAAGPEWVKP